MEKNTENGFNLYGEDLFNDPITPVSRGKIADKFLVPPFSILDTRKGYWQERKRMWISLGIKGELGRGDSLLGISEQARNHYKSGFARCFGQDLVNGENDNFSRQEADKRSNLNNKPLKPSWAVSTGTTNMAPGTSIFDPVLTELMYQWFCPAGGQVIDPFAGGSVRGIIAHLLGYHYWGCDLSFKQIKANREQAAVITAKNQPCWVIGDSQDEIADAPQADMILSCPPYGNLEVYSDDKNDLSNMSYDDMYRKYYQIIKGAVAKLKPNHYACFVVANFRNKKGYYYDFVGDTVLAFQKAGCGYYNEIILINVAGSLPIRISRQFNASRKIGKCHQNVLVFKKE